MGTGKPRYHVMVAIPTMGRESLSATIESVINSAARTDCRVKILLVFNGTTASVHGNMDYFLPDNVEIETVYEPNRGYSNARNAIIKNLDAGVLAMVDDDEVVNPDWIATGLSELRKYNADVIAGPVQYIISDPAAGWIHARRVFSSPDRKDGQELEVCSSNNLFLDTSRLRNLPNFDEQYNFTGGEDTDWTMRLHRDGARIVWSNGVSVAEFVAADRLNRQYIRRRFQNNGEILALTIYHDKSTTWLLGAGTLRIAAGIGKTLLSKLASLTPVSRIPSWRYNDAEALVWRGVGIIRQSVLGSRQRGGKNI
ncbi:glycosyltransferase family 2 protein [Rhodococcus rhodochrous]|uniref:glycosyltransferase family 2 protein n=1 Tax=Rhodococcus rhodochrous TaxID=1829 RepID=UPI0013520E2F|nr:glycosyltransferase family A protein [Rhodococcus rhodochrous]